MLESLKNVLKTLKKPRYSPTPPGPSIQVTGASSLKKLRHAHNIGYDKFLVSTDGVVCDNLVTAISTVNNFPLSTYPRSYYRLY